MGKTNIEKMQDKMTDRFEGEKGKRIAAFMEKEYAALCETCGSRPKELERHEKRNIFPVAAAFRALLAEGMERQEAADTASAAFLELMQAPAASIRKMLRFPGLYHLIPRIFKTMAKKLFSEDAGFAYRFYPTEGNEARFDMLKCPYHTVCSELDCLELAPVFCATDDLCYGNMHEKLKWQRTKTLARGGDCCDFDLRAEK